MFSTIVILFGRDFLEGALVGVVFFKGHWRVGGGGWQCAACFDAFLPGALLPVAGRFLRLPHGGLGGRLHRCGSAHGAHIDGAGGAAPSRQATATSFRLKGKR